MMKPIIKEVAKENKDTFTIAVLDVDFNPRITAKYRVEAIPTYIVFRNGKVIGRFVGGMNKPVFVRQIFDILRG